MNRKQTGDDLCIKPREPKKVKVEQKEEDIFDDSTTRTDVVTTMTTTEENSTTITKIKKRTWSSIISRDLIANIGTFLILADVWNLIQTTSSKEEWQEIQQAYLKHNFWFLKFYVKRIADTPRHSLTRCRLSSWMEINTDWKQMYDDPEEHGILTASDKHYFDMIFNDICAAIECCSEEIVTYLIEHRDVDINETNTYNGGSTLPLFSAIVCSDLSMLEFVLSFINIDVNKKLVGENVLHLIYTHIEEITPEKLNLLLKHPNINVNTQDSNGHTPLHALCVSLYRHKTSSIWKARMLLDYGADVNLHDNDGNTAIDILQSLWCDESDINVKETMIALLRRVNEGGRMTRSITG